jgi:hypothetical protein
MVRVERSSVEALREVVDWSVMPPNSGLTQPPESSQFESMSTTVTTISSQAKTCMRMTFSSMMATHRHPPPVPKSAAIRRELVNSHVRSC